MNLVLPPEDEYCASTTTLISRPASINSLMLMIFEPVRDPNNFHSVFSVSTNKIERREELIDMKILFDDFTTYVESMSDEEIKESIQNATKNTSDCMEEE